MPDDDARLDDFLGGSEDGEASGAAPTDGEEATDDAAPASGDDGDAGGESPAVTGDDPVDPSPDAAEAVDPADATYRWAGDGARCDACGAHVERLWRDEAGLVCPDCKEW